jgi:hypothetical protein
MAKRTEQICGNCGQKGVLFCDNEFTDFYCDKCGAANLVASLQKIETEIPCKENQSHDIRIARDNLLFCVKCRAEIGKMFVVEQPKVEN